MIDLDALIEQVGGTTDPDCRTVLEAYTKVISIISRSGRISESRRALIALMVLKIADERPPKNREGRLDARLLAIEALRTLMYEVGEQIRRNTLQ